MISLLAKGKSEEVGRVESWKFSDLIFNLMLSAFSEHWHKMLAASLKSFFTCLTCLVQRQTVFHEHTNRQQKQNQRLSPPMTQVLSEIRCSIPRDSASIS